MTNGKEKRLQDEQSLRSKLRERFLIAAANLNGKQCTFHLCGGKETSGVYRGADIEFSNILAENLSSINKTPNSAILRSQDVVAMNFKGIEG